MDLNELLHAHQVAVMRASSLGDGDTRDTHFAKVAEYAERVRQLRELRQMSGTPIAPPEAPTIIYATYAGDTEPGDGEPEGGAHDPSDAALPEGVTVKTVQEYRVGRYVYQDLDAALSEHMRQLSREPGQDQA